MNHSILVVICDFLVLSVLSLSLGVAPMHSNFTGRGTRIDDYTANILLDELKVKSIQLAKARDALLDAQRKLGFAETRSKRVKELNTELAKVQTRLNYLEEKLKQRKGEVGKLSKEKLLVRLEKESVRRLKVVTEMAEAKAALEFEKAKNKELADDMSALRQNAIQHEEELTEKKTLLEERTQRLQKITKELQKTESALGTAKGDLRKTMATLTAAQRELKKKAEEVIGSKQALNATKLRLQGMSAELAGVKGEAKATLLDLSYARGRLSATEKELAETRSRLMKNQRAIAVNELELKEAQNKVTSLQKILKNAVGDLSKTQNELNEYKDKAKAANEKLVKAKINLIKSSSEEKAAQVALNKTKESLKAAMERLQSEALDKYSQAAVLLKVNIKESRFLIDYESGGTFYLPEVLIDGKKYLISPLELLNSMGRTITAASKIIQLSYRVGKPKDGNNMSSIKQPLLSLNADNRVCIVEVPAVRKTALELLTYENLKKRGLQNLTLFKYTTFGQESCSLDGRSSLGLEKGDHYLYIRNSVRNNDPQLKANVGDFIITKQGQFVGIAVEVQNFDFGRKQRVKCFVFPNDFKTSNVTEIPLAKRPGNKYFTNFAKVVAAINSRIKHLNRNNK